MVERVIGIIQVASPRIDEGISFAFMCPKCRDFYAFGYYYFKTKNREIVGYRDRTTCQSCGEDRLINPVVFNTSEECDEFVSRLVAGNVTDLRLYEDVYLFNCYVNVRQYVDLLSMQYLRA